MAGDKPEFPDGDAWTDFMPDVRTGFATNSPKKAATPKPAAAATSAPDASAKDEYGAFASLDLTNIGR